MAIQKTMKLIALIMVVLAGFSFPTTVAAQPGVSVPIESFYNELAPYGQWVQHPGYGNVWLPSAGPDFQPYASGGHWVVTEYGNTWVSDYAWGWAPFHYGRWIYDPAYGGWLWIPGTDWGPAWVSWRSGGGYYGWAPLGPGWDVNVNINIPAPYWTFVPQVYITSPNLYSYCVPRPRVVNIYQNTTIINNYYRTNNRAYVYGPPRGDIERVTRRSVPVYRIDHMDRPGRSVVGNGSVGFYRPGASNDYRRDYSRSDRYDRNDRFDNSPRPNYGGNTTPNRNYNGEAGRDFNGNSTPNRTYDRGNNAPGRGDYKGNSPANPGNDYNSTPATPQNNRFERNRGSYTPTPQPGGFQPRNPQPDNVSPQPNRSFERQGGMNPQAAPSGRSGADFQRVPNNQGAPAQQRSQGQFPNPGGGERQSRGPR
ncbi:DUF6600 domain-containing protein [Spirosoma sp. KNUC1025]|uniref:DUF6600 domain-containing protein n=1 Tax=Spirosoma sp. KNUC1025 TaxID=2894082 RepID=UPI00386C6AF6|nr:hypothetical protein LN737_22395 [Spirosoma sp. KNUC1025]